MQQACIEGPKPRQWPDLGRGVEDTRPLEVRESIDCQSAIPGSGGHDHRAAAEVVAACTAERLLTVAAGENVVRLLPPLNVTEAEIGEAAARLTRALRRLSAA